MGENFIVRNSILQERGCFASKEIKKGELICIFKGEKISFKELKKRYGEGKEKICNPLQIKDKEYLDLYKPYIFLIIHVVQMLV